MSLAVGPEVVEKFRRSIAATFGLDFDDTKLAFLSDVLGRRASAHKITAREYVERMPTLPDEGRALALDLTVTETYFFRNPDQFRALVETCLPDRIAKRGSPRLLRLLSAACSSGEEPYTLALLVRDLVSAEVASAVSIRAYDVNPTMIAKARRARYSPWALRETPPAIQRRWFSAEGSELVLDDSVRRAVTFEERNLADDDASAWPPESYDVVFCRNAIMYFTPSQARSLLRRITRSLVPGGYLFLGHAETLRGLSTDYSLLHTHGTFYYRKREQRLGAGATAPTEGVDSGSASRLDAPPVESWTTTWIETVQRSSDRIRALSNEAVAVGSTESVRARPPFDLTVALELLRRERFSEALDVIGALPVEAARDPDVLLLRAVLLTHSGQLAPAEKACRELLELDELSAGAHYLLALCREAAADRAGAVDHDQVAAYLDPGFAMPRVHLGLMARRAGEKEAAQRELGQAILLLQREDTARLLLFGGGFGRDALIALCRAEVVASGGAS